jgi:hypothetical protein
LGLKDPDSLFSIGGGQGVIKRFKNHPQGFARPGFIFNNQYGFVGYHFFLLNYAIISEEKWRVKERRAGKKSA